jgi:signal transduction histidine kinase
MLVGGLLASALVQIGSLWHLDRQLTKALLKSPNESDLVKTEEAKTRLASGLKLLKAVLPINEGVVFQCVGDEFQTVARTKTGSGTGEPNRNSIWRDGVKLCQRSVVTKEVVVQASENQITCSVAVPLRHEQSIVGVLLLRLNSSFCDDDRPLLEAVGAQFARNLARDTFSKNSFDSSLFGFFSTVGSEKKLDALHVLRAVTTEQRCEANALAQVNDGIAIAYLDGTIALTNSALLGFAELTLDELTSLDVFGLLDRFRTDIFDEPAIAVRRVLQTSQDYEGELNFDQRNQILGLRISLLRENQDITAEPVGMAIFVSDLTKAKDYEKLKSDMISLMSHELRTPLTSINGFAELLTSDDTIPEQAREFVTIIANESQRMSRMINTFLAVTQLQRKDKQEVLKIPLRLDEVVRDTIATLQPVAKKKRIRLVEQPALRVPPVAADKSLITQVVKNLLHNAIKYSPERTTVTVSTALEAEAVRVCVEDRGFGIPAESKDRVWEKFYRVVREGQEKDEESTGLGLSFVREVVEQHGGSVALDSEEGRGSKFSFTLPRL